MCTLLSFDQSVRQQIDNLFHQSLQASLTVRILLAGSLIDSLLMTSHINPEIPEWT
jgi:hypothetical protein